MLEHKGIAFKRTDLFPVISQAVVRGLGFPGADRAGAEDRRAQGAGLARDLARAGPAPARAAALPRRPRAARRGRRGRALRRRGAAAPDPPDDLVGDHEGQGAAAQLLGGRQARHPDRPRGEDRGSDRRARGPHQRGQRRERARATSPRCRACSTRSTPGSRPACSTASSSTPPTSRSRPASRLAMTFQDLRPLIDDRPAGELAHAGRTRVSRATPRRSSRPPGCSSCATRTRRR